MNWLDFIIIVVIAVTTFLGFKRGLIQAVVPLLGIILAIFLAGILHESLAESIDFFDNESGSKIVAFVIILAAVSVIIYVGAMALHKVISVSVLGWMDRQGGAIFGFIVGWLICSMVVAVLARHAALPAELPDTPIDGASQAITEQLDLDGIRKSTYNTINDSSIAKFQIDTFPLILGILPGDFDAVKDYF